MATRVRSGRGRAGGLLGRSARGLVAGAAGTAAMDALWYRRYRRANGTEPFLTWELSLTTRSFENAAAPAQLGKRVASLVGIELPQKAAGLTNDVVHWATGMGWGLALGGGLAGRRAPSLLAGALLGLCAWLTSYTVLPLIGVYKPLWKYDAATLAKDLSAHLLFGATTATTLCALSRR
jgi:hypothetical protein